jgi:hypothetical protein
MIWRFVDLSYWFISCDIRNIDNLWCIKQYHLLLPAVTPSFFSVSVVWFGFLWLRQFLHVMKLCILLDELQNPGGTYCLHPHGRCDLPSNTSWHNPEAWSRKSNWRVNVKTVNSLELSVDVKLFKATSTVLWSQPSADFNSRIYFSRLTWELQWPCMDTACGQTVLAQLFSDITAMDCNDGRVVKGNCSAWNMR